MQPDESTVLMELLEIIGLDFAMTTDSLPS
jgi:hypothetical protein